MRVHMSCTTTLHVAAKTEHVCRARQSLHALHFTALCCWYPHSTASCRAWSGFFTIVWQGFLNTYQCMFSQAIVTHISLQYRDKNKMMTTSHITDLRISSFIFSDIEVSSSLSLLSCSVPAVSTSTNPFFFSSSVNSCLCSACEYEWRLKFTE